MTTEQDCQHLKVSVRDFDLKLSPILLQPLQITMMQLSTE